jgi:hypothetical protein
MMMRLTEPVSIVAIIALRGGDHPRRNRYVGDDVESLLSRLIQETGGEA